MKRGRPAGFTIIEAMLFLAISGLMVMLVMISAARPINIQRYRDSVNSFVAYLQNEYDKAVNVQNNRSQNLNCSLGGEVAEGGAEASGRGTSECSIIGRLIESSDGIAFSSRPVYATNNADPSLSDTSALVASALKTSDLDTIDNYRLEWETKLVSKGSFNGSVLPLKLLIVRSPSSGSIRSYVNTTTNHLSPAQIINSDDSQRQIELCLDPSGLVANSMRSGALLPAYASGASSIKQLAEGQCS